MTFVDPTRIGRGAPGGHLAYSAAFTAPMADCSAHNKS